MHRDHYRGPHRLAGNMPFLIGILCTKYDVLKTGSETDAPIAVTKERAIDSEMP